MHVGGIEIVLLIPGGGRQHDIGIDAGGGHAEIERHQQVELAGCRFVVPDNFLRLLGALMAEILAENAVIGAEQIFQEIFMALARSAQQVRAPDEEISWMIGRGVGIFGGLGSSISSPRF